MIAKYVEAPFTHTRCPLNTLDQGIPKSTMGHSQIMLAKKRGLENTDTHGRQHDFKSEGAEKF